MSCKGSDNRRGAPSPDGDDGGLPMGRRPSPDGGIGAAVEEDEPACPVGEALARAVLAEASEGGLRDEIEQARRPSRGASGCGEHRASRFELGWRKCPPEQDEERRKNEKPLVSGVLTRHWDGGKMHCDSVRAHLMRGLPMMRAHASKG